MKIINMVLFFIFSFNLFSSFAKADDSRETYGNFYKFNCFMETTVSAGTFNTHLEIVQNGKSVGGQFGIQQPLYDAIVTLDAKLNVGKPTPEIRHKRVLLSDKLSCYKSPEVDNLVSCSPEPYIEKESYVSLKTELITDTALRGRTDKKGLIWVARTDVYIHIVSKELQNALLDDTFMDKIRNNFPIGLRLPEYEYRGIRRSGATFDFLKSPSANTNGCSTTINPP